MRCAVLINYDFYDIHALIVFFRSTPEKFAAYSGSVREIMGLLKSYDGYVPDNAVRKMFRSDYNENDTLISWVLTDNRYTANLRIIKNESCYKILLRIFEEMLMTYDDKQRFYLLCDASHNIPLVLADVKKPKKTVKAMIKNYRKRYNDSFLRDELKIL